MLCWLVRRLVNNIWNVKLKVHPCVCAHPIALSHILAMAGIGKELDLKKCNNGNHTSPMASILCKCKWLSYSCGTMDKLHLSQSSSRSKVCLKELLPAASWSGMMSKMHPEYACKPWSYVMCNLFNSKQQGKSKLRRLLAAKLPHVLHGPGQKIANLGCSKSRCAVRIPYSVYRSLIHQWERKCIRF